MEIKAKNKIAEILLYEDIGGYFGISASEFVREVKALKNIETINLRINSNGGNVFDGITIYNYLKSHQARIEVDIDGLAASIASIIAMAGDERRIADNAWLMIHDPWVMTVGNAKELRETADKMDGIRDSLLDTYMKVSTLESDKVSKMMEEETWINANDALDWGFVTSLTGEQSIAASVRKDWFKHIPDSLKAHPAKNSAEARLKVAKINQAAHKIGGPTGPAPKL